MFKKLSLAVFVISFVGIVTETYAASRKQSCCPASCCLQSTCSTTAAASVPAPAGATSSVQSNRSYSYEPSARGNVAPAVRHDTRSSTPTFLLPKTDPRKYGG